MICLFDRDNITKERKHELEKEAVEILVSSINFENYFLKLCEQFENQETEESIFIKQIDKLECVMQAGAYGLDVSYMKANDGSITLPYLREILEELKDLTKNNEVPHCVKKKK